MENINLQDQSSAQSAIGAAEGKFATVVLEESEGEKTTLQGIITRSPSSHMPWVLQGDNGEVLCFLVHWSGDFPELNSAITSLKIHF